MGTHADYFDAEARGGVTNSIRSLLLAQDMDLRHDPVRRSIWWNECAEPRFGFGLRGARIIRRYVEQVRRATFTHEPIAAADRAISQSRKVSGDQDAAKTGEVR